MNKSASKKSEQKMCVHLVVKGQKKSRVVHLSVRKNKYYYIKDGKRVYTKGHVVPMKKSVRKSSKKRSVRKSASKKRSSKKTKKF